MTLRPLAYISFTFDHPILDGATADYFVGTIKDVIENWQRLRLLFLESNILNYLLFQLL